MVMPVAPRGDFFEASTLTPGDMGGVSSDCAAAAQTRSSAAKKAKAVFSNMREIRVLRIVIMIVPFSFMA